MQSKKGYKSRGGNRILNILTRNKDAAESSISSEFPVLNSPGGGTGHGKEERKASPNVQQWQRLTVVQEREVLAAAGWLENSCTCQGLPSLLNTGGPPPLSRLWSPARFTRFSLSFSPSLHPPPISGPAAAAAAASEQGSAGNSPTSGLQR